MKTHARNLLAWTLTAVLIIAGSVTALAESAPATEDMSATPRWLGHRVDVAISGEGTATVNGVDASIAAFSDMTFQSGEIIDVKLTIPANHWVLSYGIKMDTTEVDAERLSLTEFRFVMPPGDVNMYVQIVGHTDASIPIHWVKLEENEHGRVCDWYAFYPHTRGGSTLIWAEPDPGYLCEKLEVIADDGTSVPLELLRNIAMIPAELRDRDVYEFFMPESDVTVRGIFRRDPSVSAPAAISTPTPSATNIPTEDIPHLLSGSDESPLRIVYRGNEESYAVGLSAGASKQSAMTVSDVLALLVWPYGSLQVTDADGNKMGKQAIAATGMKITCLTSDGKPLETVTLVMSGDTNGTGVMSLTQLITISRVVTGQEQLNGPYLIAARFGRLDGPVRVSDLVSGARLLSGSN